MRLMNCIIALGFALFGAFGTAQAHRQPEMVSTITYVTNADGSISTQIVHRIHVHDALRIAALLPGVQMPSLDDQVLLDRLARYIAASLIMDSREQDVLGAELQANQFYTYVEMPGRATLVGGHGLADIDAAWQHRVDILRKQGRIESYTFTKDRGETIAALMGEE